MPYICVKYHNCHNLAKYTEISWPSLLTLLLGISSFWWRGQDEGHFRWLDWVEWPFVLLSLPSLFSYWWWVKANIYFALYTAYTFSAHLSDINASIFLILTIYYRNQFFSVNPFWHTLFRHNYIQILLSLLVKLQDIWIFILFKYYLY